MISWQQLTDDARYFANRSSSSVFCVVKLMTSFRLLLRAWTERCSLNCASVAFEEDACLGGVGGHLELGDLDAKSGNGLRRFVLLQAQSVELLWGVSSRRRRTTYGLFPKRVPSFSAYPPRAQPSQPPQPAVSSNCGVQLTVTRLVVTLRSADAWWCADCTLASWSRSCDEVEASALAHRASDGSPEASRSLTRASFSFLSCSTRVSDFERAA